MTQDRRVAPGRNDGSSAERADALLDEAVGQAAKGSYREATEKAEQALAIDPQNTAARELLDSYRRQSTDDDERRRRRRSIAAAAAAIEEMVESDQLDEASAATEALVVQFGVDAPVEDLRQRIAEAQASHLDFDELDAAIDAIRVTATTPTQAARGEHGVHHLAPGGAIVGEIEEHLRAGRLDQATSALDRLEAEPGAHDRAVKLRTRIEEALHVAADHRREEEILIATAAIEERIRRGNIDDAAERLDDLARRHGDSAPIAELEQRLDEARELRASTVGAATNASEDADAAVASVAPPPVFQSIVDEERSGRGRSIAIAVVVVIALAVGAWWLLQRDGGGAAEPAASEPVATDGSASTDGVAPAGSLDATAPTGAGSTEAPASEIAPPSDGAGAAVVKPPTVSEQNGAVAPPARTGAAPATGRAPATGAADAARANAAAPSANAPTAPAAPPPAEPAAPIASDSSAPAADASRTSADVAAPSSGPETTEVVVEALPAAESPPPPAPAPPPPAIQIEVAPPPAAPAPADETASSTPAAATDNGARTEPAAAPPPAAAAEPARAAAATSSILGCGEPGVVCVKSIQVPTPRYPAAARSRHMSGNVVVMALVDESGRVVQTRIESGSIAFFNDAAMEAAKRATFQPATRQGVPGKSWARLTFKFAQQ